MPRRSRSALRVSTDVRHVSARGASDVASVLAADLEERLGDLLQRADPGGVHPHREDVVSVDGRVLELGDRLLAPGSVLGLEGMNPLALGLLLRLGGANPPAGVRLLAPGCRAA